MASITCSLFILIALTLMASPFSAKASRSLSNLPVSSRTSLAARLKLEAESVTCWDSLFELQACSGEVITFFLSGETYLGHGCCQAIKKVIGQDCWPNIMSSLGFTNEEGDILEGYCDESLHNSPPSLVDHPKKLVPYNA
ncbi:egg cell-secreted protein 1.1-like [Prosopis cineraria]|uniref:egg cell-secreted protein 1.1-like n=1 Tax=Prosopis cineraria TaxID=364024 RepID=UPI00240F16E7|nr:egg cell-secreted protein 1.1-like [Prosopis cineraria]